jgi:glucose-1-phosphate thymidylyltransferase
MSEYRGLVLAGGSGTRLFPVTKGITKQLLPLYNKSMIYYPISVLMMAGIKDILIITTPEDADSFKRLLGDGSQFGINIQYAVQPKPEGIAQAFIIGEEFLDGHPACLILGDNIFHGSNFTTILENAKINGEEEINSATVFGYYVNDPERYGVAEFNEFGECLSIEEKPKNPKSNYAVVGLYFYPNDVVEKAKQVKPSARGELEITTLNQMYLEEGRLFVEKLPRGFAWLDTGTFDSLSEASNYVETIEKRTGQMIACLEEIGYNNGWLTKEKLQESIDLYSKNSYGEYLKKLIKNDIQ